MRVYIKEDKLSTGQTLYYKSQNNFEGEEIYSCIVSLKTERYVDEFQKTFYLLYDSNFKVISSVYRFINNHIEEKSINTKEMALVALRQLYVYCELFNVTPEKMTNLHVQSFIKFLYGINSNGEVHFDLTTKRSPQTINNYISTCREYLKYLGFEENVFNKKVNLKQPIIAKGLLGHISKNNNYRYKITQKVFSKKKVPKYINLSEYKRIIECIREEYTIREEIIVRLMFETGLRIGEVLGLTLEDLRTTVEENAYLDLGDVGEISIVNRVSDKPYQLAKNRYIPKDRSAYDLDIYEPESIQYVYPKIAIMVLIDKYIEEIHGNLSDKNRENYSSAVADIIDENNFTEENNYYIFLNKNAEPLSQSGWNKILREIFIKSGLNIDFGKRKNNLSHRFRHGYAMYLVKYRNYTPLQLKDALRHQSISTVMIYYNPTEEDIYEVNKEASDTLYEIFPELLEVD